MNNPNRYEVRSLNPIHGVNVLGAYPTKAKAMTMWRIYRKNKGSSWRGEVFDTQELCVVAEQNRAQCVEESKRFAEDDAAKAAARRARMAEW